MEQGQRAEGELLWTQHYQKRNHQMRLTKLKN